MADSPEKVTQTGDDSHQGWRVMLHAIIDHLHSRISAGPQQGDPDAATESFENPNQPDEEEGPGFKSHKGFKSIKPSKHAKK